MTANVWCQVTPRSLSQETCSFEARERLRRPHLRGLGQAPNECSVSQAPIAQTTRVSFLLVDRETLACKADLSRTANPAAGAAVVAIDRKQRTAMAIGHKILTMRVSWKPVRVRAGPQANSTISHVCGGYS